MTEKIPQEILLSQALIQCPSITPTEGGAIKLLQDYLVKLGFSADILTFSEQHKPDTDNLWAVLNGSSQGKHLCFAGHTDVVPVGDITQWTHNPFDAVIQEGTLYGRGSSDMKSAIAAFTIATQEFLAHGKGQFSGTISLMITGDEEGCGVNGTKKIVQELIKRKVKIDHCIVGEPTNPETLGTMIKVGRRGSLNVDLTVFGKQGHVAYPHLADNPTPKLVLMMSFLAQLHLDEGNALFQPSNLELTNIDIGNISDNVIPQTANGRFNIRFNSEWTGEKLEEYLATNLKKFAKQHKIDYSLHFRLSGESFITHDDALTSMLQKAIYSVTGQTAELSTTGGTSDARFIKDLCPVIEFGIVGATMHQHNESVLVDDITKLKNIYLSFLKEYFKT